jgi:hypothetical protein
LALDPQIGEDSAGDVAETGHPAGGDEDRDGDRRLREAAAAGRQDVVEPRIVEGDVGRGQAIGEVEAAERSVEQGGEPDLLAGHVRKQGRGPVQVGADPDTRKAAGGEIDGPGAFQLQRRRAKRQPTVQLAIGEGGVSAHRDRRSGQPLLLAGQERRRRSPAGQAVAALFGAQPERSRSTSADVEQSSAVPGAPAARAFDAQGDRPPGADHRADQAVGRRGKVDVEVETVAVRLRIESHGELFAALPDRPVDPHQRPAGANLDLAAEPRDPLLAGHRRARPKLGDVEAGDADIEAWQDRLGLLARLEPGQAVKNDQLGIEIADDQPVGDPAERLPVQVDPGRFGEQPPGIVEPDVAKPGSPPDRSLDPADMDLEAGIGRQSGDPIGEETVSRRGVEQDHEKQSGQDQAEQKSDNELGEPAVPAAAADLHHRFGRAGLFRVHQKAWPSET